MKDFLFHGEHPKLEFLRLVLPKALVATATPDLPLPRHLWRSRDVAPGTARRGMAAALLVKYVESVAGPVS